MTSARRLKGLDTIRDATARSTTAIPVLILDDVVRGALTVREAATFLGLPYRLLHDLINAGRVRVISIGNRERLITVKEVVEILSWDDYLDPTA